MNTSRINVFAGLQVYQASRQAMIFQEGTVEDLRQESTLTRAQEVIANRSYVGAKLVDSVEGWTIRYDSGLQDFALLAGVRTGQINGSLADAMRWAEKWVAEDPAHRYAWHWSFG